MVDQTPLTVSDSQAPCPQAPGGAERSMRALCRHLRTLAGSDPARALNDVATFVLEVIIRQSSIGRVFSSPELDSICEEIGASLTADVPRPSEQRDHIVYLLTQIGPYGGHSRVLRDLIAAEPRPKKTLLLTHVAPAVGSDFEFITQAGVSVEIAPDLDLAARTRWVAGRIADLAPRKTYMMLHHFDSVSVAATRPDLAGRLVYIHNCDHSLALGVHIPHAVHADFHRKGYFHCLNRLSGQVPYIIPLTADDLGSRYGNAFYQRGHLTSCSSGGFEKFTNGHYAEIEPYAYGYAEAVRVLLAASRGTHIHIGPLPQEFVEEIYAKLHEVGVPETRFVHIKNAESVWRTLLKENVDVYLGSVPFGGGRATVEAMGAGVPLIIHSNYRSEFLGVEFEVYRGAMIWRDFDELRQHVLSLNSSALARHGILARSYYEANHSAAKFREALARIERGLPQPPPQIYHYEPDGLQVFVDQHPDIYWPV